MRIVFMGTPDFAVRALDALAGAGHEIVAVYSQPPRPAGRGHKEQPSPVHAFAAAQGIQTRTPLSLKSRDEQEKFAALGADLAVVAAYGLILPRPVLDAPRLGCVNIHASLLPRWRGAAPIQRAIEAGDDETGITIMRMEEGLDTGPMLLSGSLKIGTEMNAGELHDRLAAMGAEMIVEAVKKLAAGELRETPQPEAGVTYARKIGKEEGRIDWSAPAELIARRIRALTPWPGAWCLRNGERLKIIKAEAAAGNGRPGELTGEGALVACGEGKLRLLTVQKAGGAPIEAAAYLRGHPARPGEQLA